MQNHYKTLIVLAIILVTLGFMALDRTSIMPDESPHAAQGQTTGPIVPDVTFALLDGGEIKLHSLTGHTVLLHFWASWCVPCREEFSGLMERMQKDQGDSVLLAVSADAKAEDANRFLARYRSVYPALFASGKVVAAHDAGHTLIEGVFQTFQYPETIIIGPNLRMQRKIVGIYK